MARKCPEGSDTRQVKSLTTSASFGGLYLSTLDVWQFRPFFVVDEGCTILEIKMVTGMGRPLSRYYGEIRSPDHVGQQNNCRYFPLMKTKMTVVERGGSHSRRGRLPRQSKERSHSSARNWPATCQYVNGCEGI